MINRILYVVVVVGLVWFGVSWKSRWGHREAVEFNQWLQKAVMGDPRYKRLVLEGVGWSGPGHPVYISISGTVDSRAEWLALRNLIRQANPPVKVEILAIFLEKEHMLAGYLE